MNRALILAVALALAVPATAVASDAAVPALYKNCTNLNKKYPHGLGRANARDNTSGEPVTTFKRSTRLYRIAMNHNGRLDRDKDGDRLREGVTRRGHVRTGHL